MSAAHPDCMADLERKYDGPIDAEEMARVRAIEKKRAERERLRRADDEHVVNASLEDPGWWKCDRV